MKTSSTRWKTFARTPFPWEAEAVAYLRERLMDVEPNRGWALFEFVSSEGSINEVDALILTAKGFYLVEIKSHPCRVTGDAGTWTWRWPDGRKRTEDNPLLGADRKAKRLKSLLERQKAMRDYRLPYLQPVVFLSHEAAEIQLDPSGRHHVYGRDREAKEGQPRPGIIAALTQLTDQERQGPRRTRIDAPLAAAIARAMEQAGIRASTRERRFGAYELGQLLLEGPGYQDWLGRHTSLEKVQRRIRIYPIAPDADVPTRQMLHRAARREFTVLQGVAHDGILPALEFQDGDQGPGLIFEHLEDARRLDHFLLEEGERLNLTERLDLLRQIAEAMAYAHEKRLVHRALSPLSVLVHRDDQGQLRTRLYNWQTAARDSAATTQPSSGTLTVHVEQLVEPAATVYLAPETLNDPSERAEHLDVFGLGAIAFLLFANRPPAADYLQLRERLNQEKGLSLAATIDGAHPELVDLIRDSTHPEVGIRLASVREFLARLDRIEEALTRPDSEVHDNPTDAIVGQRFPQGWVIKRRLGKGSSAVVFLVQKGDDPKEERVLKLALDPAKNDVLEAEAKVLSELHHAAIVRHRGTLDVGGHFGILLDKAGEETLADRLRKEGPITFELLQRFGEDLLGAVQYLEEHGLFHRDLKPDNIGVTPVGRGDLLHLVLFDFSLCTAPVTQVQAGTRAYLDPFLGSRHRRQYDPAAERYAAAVTLYEMATGQLPRWGDGRSAPAAADDIELEIDEHAFAPELREDLEAFFRCALHRDAAQRFHNAEEMKRRWHAIFQRAAAPALVTEPISDVQLTTPLRLLGLSTRAVNVLERDAVETVQDLLQLPLNLITHRKGVGTKTRQELLRVVSDLRTRFPDVQPVRARGARRTSAPEEDGDAADASAAAEPSAPFVLDQLVDRLVPQARGRSAREREAPEILRRLLGAGERAPGSSDWPTQTEVAKDLRLTTVQVHQVLAKARERWRRLSPLTRIRGELGEWLRAQGGIAPLDEAALSIAQSPHAQGLPPAVAAHCARQILRAAVEVEASLDEPLLQVSRRQDAAWIVTGVLGDAVELDPGELVGYAMELGRRAERLAKADPLVTPQRVLEELRQVAVPAGMPLLNPERLVRLAAAAGGVAVSSRLELYPRGMAADRALRLAHGALLGATSLTTAQLRERIEARYPDAEPLPVDPHRLAAMLGDVLPELRWDATQSLWRFQVERTSSLAGERTLDSRPSTWSRPAPDSPEVADARRFDERLRRAVQEGHFLVLAVPRKNHEAALRQLVARFAVEAVSVERLLLERLREEASRRGIAWSKVLDADAQPFESEDRRRLLQLVHLAAKDLGDAIGEGKRTVLLTRLGVLPRYGLMAVLNRLRDRTQLKPGQPHALHGAWVLVATNGLHERPVLDKEPIPVIDRHGWADVPEAWIQSVHLEKAS